MNTERKDGTAASGPRNGLESALATLRAALEYRLPRTPAPGVPFEAFAAAVLLGESAELVGDAS